jgi:hypothetical protein
MGLTDSLDVFVSGRAVVTLGGVVVAAVEANFVRAGGLSNDIGLGTFATMLLVFVLRVFRAATLAAVDVAVGVVLSNGPTTAALFNDDLVSPQPHWALLAKDVEHVPKQPLCMGTFGIFEDKRDVNNDPVASVWLDPVGSLDEAKVSEGGVFLKFCDDS